MLVNGSTVYTYEYSSSRQYVAKYAYSATNRTLTFQSKVPTPYAPSVARADLALLGDYLLVLGGSRIIAYDKNTLSRVNTDGSFLSLPTQIE